MRNLTNGLRHERLPHSFHYDHAIVSINSWRSFLRHECVSSVSRVGIPLIWTEIGLWLGLSFAILLLGPLASIACTAATKHGHGMQIHTDQDL